MRLLSCYAPERFVQSYFITLSIIAWIVLSSTPPALAQHRPGSNIRFGVLSVQHGLPSNIVYRTIQDRQGFMWFATMDGLARYDGYAIRVWRHNDEDTTGLTSSDIRCLYEDASGILWIGTQAGGVNRFDPRTETFTHFRHRKGNLTTLDGDEVAEIFEDKTHRFWILSSGTLHHFDRATGKVLQKYRSREASANPAKQAFTPLGTSLANTAQNAFQSIFLDTDGNILVYGNFLPPPVKGVGVAHQWGKLNTETGKVTLLFADALLNTSEFRGAPFKLNDSITLIGSAANGLAAYNTRTHRVTRRYLPEANNPRMPTVRYCSGIFKDEAKKLWMPTLGGGISLYHPETDDFTNFFHDPYNPSSIPFNTIMDIYQGKGGIVWFSTPAGVAFYDSKADKFTPFTAEFPDAERGVLPAGKPLITSTRLIFSMKPTRSNPNILWICATSEAGLLRFDARTHAFERFRNTAVKPDDVLPNNNVYSCAERPDGTLWLSFRHGGVVLFDPRTRKIRERYLSEHATMPILEDSLSFPGKQRLWAGDLGAGLYRIDCATKKMKNYAHDAGNPRSFIGSAVFEAEHDKHGRLWFGSMQGLSLYQPATDDFTNFVNDPANPRSISCNYVECVVQDSKGRLWIGTEDGLNLFDEQKQDFTRFGVKEGLPSPVILGILEDKHGNLWLSTNNGLSCFNPSAHTFRNYDESDGLHGKTFNSHAFCQTADGQFWFGGVGGFNSFHPDSLRDNALPPPVILTEFRKFNKSVRLDSSIGFKTELTLDYSENYITFGFAALNFTRPEKNRYKYKLEGFDRDWIDAGTRREASYTNLDGGEYVFRVIACNNDGVWNLEGARLFIVITPPFWRTPWFIACVACTLVVGTTGGMTLLNSERLRKQYQRFELATVRQQAEHQHQLEITRAQVEAQAHERERIFRDIHDGLGAQIVEIVTMTEQLKNEIPPFDDTIEGSAQSEWVQAITASVQELRGSLREIVWLLNMENDTIEALVAYLRQETARVLEGASIHISFSVDPTLPDVNVHPEVRRHVVMAVREATSNVIKHAGASTVVISAYFAGETLTVKLNDNGQGFTPENIKRFSNGLKTMQKRMTLCGGTMTLNSAPNAGTSITFTIPFSS